MENNKPKVALVHDFLTQCGGAERVLEVLAEMYPEAPIYTLLYDKEKMHGKFKDKRIYTSFLQKFPRCVRKRYKWLLPLMPIAPETFDLRDYDLIISSSGAWSKGIVTRLNSIHVAYLHSPMRFVWDSNEEYLKQQKNNFLTKYLARRMLNYIRVWDKVAADRPDYIISNSKYTHDRVKKYYRRESVVIYPPVEMFRRPTSKEGEDKTSLDVGRLSDKYFLVVSRLSAYKKVDVVVEAFNKLKLPLVVVGEGEQKKHLEKIAGENIKILGWQSDKKLSELYQNARAFIFPSVDDFGIAPVEALAHGVPLLAIRSGGVKEIMVEGKTGEFFDVAVPEIVADAVRRFRENEASYDREFMKSRAGEFGKERFIEEFREFIKKIK